MILAFASHMRILTLVFVGLGALAFVWMSYHRSRPYNLDDIFIVGLSTATLPTGALISLSAFEPSLLATVADAGVYLFLAGVAVVYIGCSAIKARWPRP